MMKVAEYAQSNLGCVHLPSITRVLYVRQPSASRLPMAMVSSRVNVHDSAIDDDQLISDTTESSGNTSRVAPKAMPHLRSQQTTTHATPIRHPVTAPPANRT